MAKRIVKLVTNLSEKLYFGWGNVSTISQNKMIVVDGDHGHPQNILNITRNELGNFDIKFKDPKYDYELQSHTVEKVYWRDEEKELTERIEEFKALKKKLWDEISQLKIRLNSEGDVSQVAELAGKILSVNEAYRKVCKEFPE
jgi:PAS domain-containing protein